MNLPKLTKWLDAIEKILARQGKSVADFAREIGKPGNYNQVYYWLKVRGHEPKGEVTIACIEWALRQEPALIKLFSRNGQRATGRKLKARNKEGSKKHYAKTR